ncbi:MAG: C39 family peptidase [Lentimicrobiaceae bacterium]|nr:C39 family peptidase [Lentimicrobiaceae bacterium]
MSVSSDILLLFLGLTGTLHAQNIALAVPLVTQAQSNWCSAAAAESVLAYRGISKTQCAIMQYVLDLDGYNGNNCCATPSLCNEGVVLGFDNEPNSIKGVLKKFGLLECEIVQTCSWYSTIEEKLTQNRPLIAHWDLLEWPFGAHVVVIYGIKNWDIVLYMDPSNDPKYGGKRELSWHDFNCYLKKEGDGGFPNPHWWRGSIIPCLSTRDYPCDDGGGGGGGGGDDPCSNCIPGEETINCGGTCTSCGYVGGYTNEKNITSTAQLSSEIMAFKRITAGVATTVASGKEVNFITKETGSIVLGPGFTAEEGSNFSTQMKDLSQYERLCGAICYDYILPDALTKPSDELYIYNLLYALEFRCDIYNSSGEHIYSKIHSNIISDGDFYIWDCLHGVYDGYNVPTGRKYFKMKYAISYCNGAANFSGKEHNFYVDYVYDKSLTEAPEAPETPPQFSPPHPNNIPLHSATAPPQFTILPNPNPGTFQLETNFPLTNIAHLKIITPLGATLYETQTLSSHTIQLPTSATGLHFVVIMLKTGAVLTQKMMIQR